MTTPLSHSSERSEATGPMQQTAHPNRPSRSTAVLQLLRALGHLVVIIAIGFWAYTDWTLPWPGLLAGTGCVTLAVVIWAVFLSPKPMLHTDRFGHALVELLFLGAGVFAMLASGVPWPVAAGFGIVAAALGYIVPERSRT